MVLSDLLKPQPDHLVVYQGSSAYNRIYQFSGENYHTGKLVVPEQTTFIQTPNDPLFHYDLRSRPSIMEESRLQELYGTKTPENTLELSQPEGMDFLRAIFLQDGRMFINRHTLRFDVDFMQRLHSFAGSANDKMEHEVSQKKRAGLRSLLTRITEYLPGSGLSPSPGHES